MSAEALHVSNHSFANASALVKGNHEKALNLGHRVHHATENAQCQLAFLQSQKPSLLDVLLGKCAEQHVGVDFGSLDKALKEADELVDLVGNDGTVEIGAEQHAAIMLKENLQGVIEMVAPLRAALRAKR